MVDYLSIIYLSLLAVEYLVHILIIYWFSSFIILIFVNKSINKNN